jgi:hypothetical protein
MRTGDDKLDGLLKMLDCDIKSIIDMRMEKLKDGHSIDSLKLIIPEARLLGMDVEFRGNKTEVVIKNSQRPSNDQR